MENNRDEFPNLGFDGNRVLNEITWQIEHNPLLSEAERAWFGAIRTLMCNEFLSYEDAIKEAEAKANRNPDFSTDEIGRWDD